MRGCAVRLFRRLSFEEHPGDNSWLDLRWCAAIGLSLAWHGHRAWVEAKSIASQWNDYILLNGWISVDLFFVLT